MKPRLKIFLAVQYIGFIALAVYLYQQQGHTLLLEEVLFFTLALLITDNITGFLNNSSEITVSISLPIMIPAMIIMEPFWVGLIVFIGTISVIEIRDFVWYKFFFNRSNLFIAASCGTLVFRLANIYVDSAYFVLPIFLGSLVYFLINNGTVYLVVKVSSAGKQGSSLLIYYFELVKNFIFSYFLGLLFYYSYTYFGKVFFVLAIILIYVLKDFIFSRIQQLNSFTQIVESFLKVIDSKDHYTEGHCERVANYTRILCKELGMRKGKVERIVNMAKIHDIGKIYVDDSILKSSTLLTPAEYSEMKKHSYYGYELLKDIDILKKDLDIILFHHEKYDGTGYPNGIKGENIPLGSRVLSVCDAFDVMTQGRSYKPAMNKMEIINEFRACSGSSFDPLITRVMLSMINRGEFDDVIKEEDISDEFNNIKIRSALKLNISRMEG